MKVTVVTVAYNEEKNIARTIESVLRQTTNDIEYIICDGGSKDATVEIALRYSEAFAERGIVYTVSSEKDNGIYDAMNKGVAKASGDYIHFLNSGDWLYDENVIENVLKAASNDAPDVIYGDIAYVERNAVSVQGTDHEGLCKGMTMAHPATIVAAYLMKEKKFDMHYKIAADFNLLLKLKLEGRSFKNIHIPMTYFPLDGVSSRNIRASLAEQRDVLVSNGLEATDKNDERQAYKNAAIRYIKSIIPERIWQWWCTEIKHKTMIPPQ